MKIGFDAKRLFFNNTGLGNYSRTLVENMHTYFPDIAISLFANKIENSPFKNFQKLQVVDPLSMMSSIWRSFSIYNDINLSDVNIYHGLSNELPFTADRIKSKKIVTIHDLFYDKFPKDFSFIDRNLYKLKTEFACKKADHIIAISQATKTDIVNNLKIDPGKVSVVYQSCNKVFQDPEPSGLSLTITDKYNRQIPEYFILFVGTLNERKNILGLLKAIKILPNSLQIPLVMVGTGSKSFTQKLNQYIKDNKLNDEVFSIESIPNQDLISLYYRARFTCLPSFYEGFGIPIIESLFCNTPVLAGNNSAMIESTGKCGLIVDPFSIEMMSDSLQRMISDDDLLEGYSSEINSHLKKFSSFETASSMFTVYSDINY